MSIVELRTGWLENIRFMNYFFHFKEKDKQKLIFQTAFSEIKYVPPLIKNRSNITANTLK